MQPKTIASPEPGGMMKLFTPRSQGVTLLGTLLTVLLIGAGRADDEKPPEKPQPGQVEARFADDSSLKMTLREEFVEIVTVYGKLRVPIAEIKQIEFATRIS